MSDLSEANSQSKEIVYCLDLMKLNQIIHLTDWEICVAGFKVRFWP